MFVDRKKSRQATTPILSKAIVKVMLLSLLFNPFQAALADDPPKINTVPAPVKKGIHRPGIKVTSRSTEGPPLQELKQPPTMPGINLPSGKFLYGFETPTKNGTTMGARFQVPDSPEAVISRYRDILKSDGWKVNEQISNPKKVFASSQRYKASVTVTTFPSMKGGCEAYFTYGATK